MADIVEFQGNAEQRKRFCFDNFPETDRELRQFIFGLAGHQAESKMTVHDWLLFNSSMNKGLGLKLDHPKLAVLSMLDSTLADVKRFAGMPHMSKYFADSTAAHSKQVMRLTRRIFAESLGPSLAPSMQQLQREAMVGAWVHDMGEIVMELTTADDVFDMSPAQRTEIGHAKDSMERDLFQFSLELAAHERERPHERKGLYANTIHAMKKKTTSIIQIAEFTGRPRAETVMECIAVIRDGMKRAMAENHLPETPSPMTRELMDIYNRTEQRGDSSNFLHPLVKTIESMEGQRYLQRNAQRSGEHMRLEYSTSNQVIQSIKRIEARLPLLFARAKTANQLKLAATTADFVYDTIIRGCEGDPAKYSLIPPLIKRDADRREEVSGNRLMQDEKNIAQVRADTHSLWQEQKERDAKRGLNGPNAIIYTREEVAALYKAMKRAMHKGNYTPSAEHPCLLAIEDNHGHALVEKPQLPMAILEELRAMEREQSQSRVGNVSPFGPPSPRGRS